MTRDVIKEEDEEDQLLLAVVNAVYSHRLPTIIHSPLRNQSFIQQLRSNDRLLYMTCGTTRPIFNQLLELLGQNGIDGRRYIKADEQLAIFLHTCRTACSNDMAQIQFARSAETISISFHVILAAFAHLHRQLVSQSCHYQDLPLGIQESGKFFPYFKDCIGALDGTHIPVHVPAGERAVWRDYKNNLSQNVLAVCALDGQFSYIHAGWEGSAHDGRVLKDAVIKGLLQPIPGKYWLADAAYGNCRYLMVPYAQTRYHLQEFNAMGRGPVDHRELFNLRHSALRTTIERCFGILKTKFHILTRPMPYSIATQVQLVYALTGLYNIIVTDSTDSELLPAQAIDDGINCPVVRPASVPSQRAQATEMSVLRDQIAHQMWQDYQGYLAAGL